MKRRKSLILMTVLTVIIFASSSLFAQNGSTNQNQNQVKNQVKFQDQNRLQNKIHGNHFIDLNNDGYNDNAPDADGDGIPNGQDADYTRPLNGKGSKFMGDKTGYGNGYKSGPHNGSRFGQGNSNGNCDGTGPWGIKRGGRK